MVTVKHSLWVGGLGAGLLCAAAAGAQEAGNSFIGPPQLRDFQLQPQERIVTQPEPAPSQAPVVVAPPPPVTTAPQPGPSRQAPPPATRPAPTTTRPTAPPPQIAPSAAPPAAGPSLTTPSAGPPPSVVAPLPNEPAPLPTSEPAPAPPAESAGPSYWLYGLPAALLALMGVVVLARRRRVPTEAPLAMPEPAAAPPRQPRADPIQRPWVELDLKTERASFTDAEANVNFVLEIRNTGMSDASNLRIDVKMFNAGQEQDKEIGAFFRTAGRQSTRLNLPGIAPGESGVIRGEVGIPREEIRALRLDDRTLFIPVVAVNALYDCGDGRTGQSSKSYIVGRELQEHSEKMGAFRVDQGPRIWRTVGQRQHKLARRM